LSISVHSIHLITDSHSYRESLHLTYSADCISDALSIYSTNNGISIQKSDCITFKIPVQSTNTISHSTSNEISNGISIGISHHGTVEDTELCTNVRSTF